MFDRLDPAAREIFVQAQTQARELNHHYLGTEHVLLALALAGGPVADLLAERGCRPADIRAEILDYIGEGEGRPHRRPDELLAGLGIDLAEVRRRAEATFGSDAVAEAVLRTRPRRRHLPVIHRWWPGCDRGTPCYSALLGTGWLGFAPRLKSVLQDAQTTAAPAQVTPRDLLVAILDEGGGVACRILVRRHVDLTELVAALRSSAP
jgi:Clp amino terminal domain, pathogenicity island component